jgi:uncharacterized protein YqeY
MIKEKIQTDFITAMKAKDENAKAALSSIKAKITESEKVNGNELSDDEIIKVINKAIKQREESAKIYSEGGREEMARKESDEACVLRNYMPAQMSDIEIEVAIREIIIGLPVMTNPKALSGRIMGEFNKKYQGRSNPSKITEIINKLIIN